MSHKRIYKEAFDKQYVIEELKRCSGTQFDPLLVNEFIDLLEEENIISILN
jgi:HD-GYP domain-containing protein (c-di-GMP phosphodiesterase class II)